MFKKTATVILALLFVAFAGTFPLGCGGQNHDDDHGHSAAIEEQHDDHDHSVEAEDHHDGQDDDHDHSTTSGEQHDDLDDLHEHDEGESEDHSDHNDEGVIELSTEAMKLAGIALTRVKNGRIGKAIYLPGEVGFNEDRLVHVAPRFAGIAKEARKRVGDYVNVGDVIAVVESNESLTPYTIAATISGWIIKRHVTPGEFVSEEHTIYVIADLSSVWVNLAVYPKDAEHIAKGQQVFLKAIGSETRTEGTIEYVTPVLDVDTRSITARVVLPNRNNTWRPGTFVQAQVRMELGEECLVVEREAVQILDDEHVVFVAEGAARFRSVPVVIGESDSEYTSIISGLEEGTQYVAGGAFELKAKIVTSSLGAHAGHGH
jgi:cobalt-zinc-cadmium efflux system membrane fusion protein